MVLYDLVAVKALLKETGASNNPNIEIYGKMADNYIWGDLIAVKGLADPLVVNSPLDQKTIDKIRSHATSITVGYFFKFESGDTITSDAAELSWKAFFQNKFQRPRFLSTPGF
jgi:hypothetical protein